MLQAEGCGSGSGIWKRSESESGFSLNTQNEKSFKNDFSCYNFLPANLFIKYWTVIAFSPSFHPKNQIGDNTEILNEIHLENMDQIVREQS